MPPSLSLGRLRALLGAVVLLTAAGCDSEVPCSQRGDCPEPGPGVVDGVDLGALFAVPTPQEVEAVEAAWASAPDPRRLVPLDTLDLGGRETVTVLGGQDDGSPTRFLAAVRQPPRAAGDQRRRPLLVAALDDRDLDLDAALSVLPIRADLRDAFVIAFVVPRGGTLRVGGQTFRTEAPGARPYAPEDPVDALAAVAYVRQQAAGVGADPSRVAFVGHGRGGHTLLLAGARTDADAYLLSLAAPTSLFLPSVREAARRYLLGQETGEFPGLREVFDATVGRVRSGTLTVAEARLALVAGSPALFTDPPPQARPPAVLFAAHGGRDPVVPEAHGRALDPLIRATAGAFLFLPEAGHDTILQAPEVLSAGAGYLCDTVLSGEDLCS